MGIENREGEDKKAWLNEEISIVNEHLTDIDDKMVDLTSEEANELAKKFATFNQDVIRFLQKVEKRLSGK